MPQRLLLLGVGLVLGVAILQPLGEMVGLSLEGAAGRRFASLLLEPAHLRALLNSLGLAALSVFACAALGVPLALLTHGGGRAGLLLRALALSPLFLPPVLGTISFYFLFAPGGLASRLLGGTWVDFRGFGAVLVVHALTMFVYFMLFVAAALARLPAEFLEAARTLGATRQRVLLTVTLPLLRPALAGAAALTFMSAMASFTAPYIFGSGERYLTTAIVVARQDDPSLAAALAVLLTLISTATVLGLQRGVRKAVAGSGRALRVEEGPRGAARGLRLGLAALLVLLPLLPFATLVILSFKPYGRLGPAPLLADLTLDHYRGALQGVLDPTAAGPGAELLQAIGRSALYSLTATLANVVVALALVLGAVRAPRLLRAAFTWISLLPLAVPGTVIGLSLVAAFAVHGPLGLGGPLVGTALMLPLAYFVRNLPILARAVGAGLAQMPPALPEAARTLGAGPLRAVWTVVLPALLPAVAGGAILAFITAMGEFVASILIYTPSTRPASVAIYDEFRSGLFGPAAAAGVLLALATALLLLLGRLLVRRRLLAG